MGLGVREAMSQHNGFLTAELDGVPECWSGILCRSLLAACGLQKVLRLLVVQIAPAVYSVV